MRMSTIVSMPLFHEIASIHFLCELTVKGGGFSS